MNNESWLQSLQVLPQRFSGFGLIGGRGCAAFNRAIGIVLLSFSPKG
jgi:hypothetical protein